MCGITGIYGVLDSAQHVQAVAAVGRMNAALAHRGPDASGVWSDDRELVLGHRRLSVIDIQESSNQPFIDGVSGDVLIFNGEVYNYRELRDELKKNIFKE